MVPILMMSTSAAALWSAWRSSAIKRALDSVAQLHTQAMVNVWISEQDSATVNYMFLAHLLTHQTCIVFWVFCTIHQNHAIQSAILAHTQGGLELIHSIYSGSLLLRDGSHWLRLCEALPGVVNERLMIRPLSQRPRDDSFLASWIMSFVAEGLPNEDTRTRRLYIALAAFFNGSCFGQYLTHWCAGESCCRDRKHAVDTATDLLLQTIFRSRPVVPILARWSKGVGSLDFWAPGMFFNNILLWAMDAAFKSDATTPSKVGGDDLANLLGRVEQACVEDIAGGWAAIVSARLRRTFATLGSPSCLPLLVTLAITLAPLRYVSKWLQGPT